MALDIEVNVATGDCNGVEASPSRENPLLKTFRENGGLEEFLQEFHQEYSNLDGPLPVQAYEELRSLLLPFLFTRVAFPYIRDRKLDAEGVVVHSPSESQRLYLNYGFPNADIRKYSFGGLAARDQGHGISVPPILVTEKRELKSRDDIIAVGVYTITGDRRKVLNTQYNGFELDRTQSETREPILPPNTQFILALPLGSGLIYLDQELPAMECIVVPISRSEMAQFLDQYVLYPYAPDDWEISATPEDIDDRSFEEAERARRALSNPQDYSIGVQKHARQLRQQGVFDPPRLIK